MAGNRKGDKTVSERPGFMLYFADLEAVRKHLDTEQLGRLFDAIIDYAEQTTKPVFDSDPLLDFAWDTIRPRLDRDREVYDEKREKNRENARKRWDKSTMRPHTSAYDRIKADAADANTNSNTSINSNTSTNDNSSISEEASPPPSRAEEYFREQFGSNPSPSSMEKLRSFEDELGPDVCIRAIDTAIDAGKPFWGYVAGILSAKQEQGVHSLEEWDRLEAVRKKGNRGKTEQVSASSTVDRGDLDTLIRNGEILVPGGGP